MPDTTATTVSEKAAIPSTILADALRNPLALAARRAELLQLATDRASKLAAEARARVEAARVETTARVQGLRKASDTMIAGALDHGRAWRVTVPARLRRVAHDQLLRAAAALQSLAKRVEPVGTAPGDMPVPTAKA